MYSTVDVSGRSRADGGGLYGSVTVVCTVDVSGRSNNNNNNNNDFISIALFHVKHAQLR